MTFKDTMEIGLKEDAAFRRDNLPAFQKAPGGPDTRPGDPTRSPEEPGARHEADEAGPLEPQPGPEAPACELPDPSGVHVRPRT